MATNLPIVKTGDTGNAVKALQKLLQLSVDGTFGVKTEAAVKAAQRAAGIKQTGVVDSTTWDYIIAPKPDYTVTVSGDKVTLNGRTVTVWNQHKRSGTYKAHLSSNGCGHCCCAMAAVLMGKKSTPEDEMALAVKTFGKPSRWIMSGGGMVKLLHKYGITAEYKAVTSANLPSIQKSIDKALKNGHPVACWTDDNGHSGDPFATGHHWVLAVGYDKNGKVIVANSGNRGPVNRVSLSTLCKFLYNKCVGGDAGWYTSVSKAAGIVFVGV